MEVHLKSEDEVEKTLDPIGDMSCNSRRKIDLWQLKGSDIDSVKMNIESDHVGVATKIRRRGDDHVLYKTGERDNSLAEKWYIPEGKELVGFYAGMNMREEIVELGIVTRVSSLPNMCQDAYREIIFNIHQINSLNAEINSNNEIINSQVDNIAADLHSRLDELNVDERLEQVNQDVEQRLGEATQEIEN